MQLKDIFSASSDGVSQPSNSTLRFKQKALAATILATLAIEDSRKGLSHRSRQKHERARLFNRPRASRHLGRREGSG